MGEVAIIRETVDGVVQEVWNGNGPATILPPGESGWKNPGLDIRTEDGDSIALLVLRRVEEGYFTTANSGVYYKIIEFTTQKDVEKESTHLPKGTANPGQWKPDASSGCLENHF